MLKKKMAIMLGKDKLVNLKLTVFFLSYLLDAE